MKIIKFITILLTSIYSLTAQASETITLDIPNNIGLLTCPSPVWKNLSVTFKGVEDKRTSKEVGLQVKGDVETAVETNPPLEKIFESALKGMLPTCGMVLKSGEGEEGLSMTVQIDEFYASSTKKLLTGKATATSRVTIVLERDNATTQMIDVGFTIENKKGPKKNLKQLKEILNQLFIETLQAIPKTRDMQGLD